MTTNQAVEPALSARTTFADYAKALLTAVGSLFFALLVPSIVEMVRVMSPGKATGLAAMAGGLMESLFSPWFWVLYLLFFSALFAAAWSKNGLVRVVFFWIPPCAMSALGLGLWLLFRYATIHSRLQ